VAEHVINFKLTQEEFDRLSRKATAAGMTVYGYILAGLPLQEEPVAKKPVMSFGSIAEMEVKNAPDLEGSASTGGSAKPSGKRAGRNRSED
jgi:hypothetical protein